MKHLPKIKRNLWCLLGIIVVLTLVFTIPGCQSRAPESASSVPPEPSQPAAGSLQVFPFYYGDRNNHSPYGLIDASGNIISEPQYTRFDYIYDHAGWNQDQQPPTIFGLFMFETQESGDPFLGGTFVSADGKIKREINSHYLDYRNGHYAIAYSGTGQQLFDLSTGQTVLEDYTYLEFISKDLLVGTKNDDNESFLLDLQGKQIAQLPYQSWVLYPATNDFVDTGLYPIYISSDSKDSVLINRFGEVVLPKSTSEFVGHLALVREGSETQLINTDLQVLASWSGEHTYVHLYQNFILVENTEFPEDAEPVRTVALYKRDLTPVISLKDGFAYQLAYGYLWATEYDYEPSTQINFVSKSRLFDPQGQEIPLPPIPIHNLILLEKDRFLIEQMDLQKGINQYALIDGEGREVVPFGRYASIHPTNGRNFLICYAENYTQCDLLNINGETLVLSCQTIIPLPDDSRFWIERGSYSGYTDSQGNWLYKQSRFQLLND